MQKMELKLMCYAEHIDCFIHKFCIVVYIVNGDVYVCL